MPIDICEGKPSYNEICPHKHICQFHINFKRAMKLHYMDRPALSHISAFYCSSKNWHKFELFEEYIQDESKFVTLTNGMVIKYAGITPKTRFNIYQIVLPIGQKTALLYDGKQFFSTTEDNLLEPHSLLANVSIKSKGTENG